MAAFECLEHKWLDEYSPAKSLGSISPLLSADTHLILTDCRSDSMHNSNKSTIPNGTHLRNIKNQTDTDKLPSMTQNGTTTDHVSDENRKPALGHSTGCSLLTVTAVDYTSNKENILESRNISKLLSPSTGTTNLVTISNGSNSFILEFVDDSNASVSVTATTPVSNSSKHQPSLFPDAPTTPKVCRKSSPDSPPSVKTLVKKFQLDAVECVNVLCASGSDDCDVDSDRAYCSTAKLATMQTTVATNGDDSISNDTYQSIVNCSSSIGTSVTTTSVAGTSCPSMCLCGKPSGCCCHLLNCRGKSIVVIDNSIVC